MQLKNLINLLIVLLCCASNRSGQGNRSKPPALAA